MQISLVRFPYLAKSIFLHATDRNARQSRRVSLTNTVFPSSKGRLLNSLVMDSLPVEIVSRIISYLERHELKSTRLVCHGFAGIAAPPLFSRVAIWIEESSIQRLLNISRTYPINTYLKSIEVDVREFDKGTADSIPVFLQQVSQWNKELKAPRQPLESFSRAARRWRRHPDHSEDRLRIARMEYVNLYTKQEFMVKAGIFVGMLSSAFTSLPNLRAFEIFDWFWWRSDSLESEYSKYVAKAKVGPEPTSGWSQFLMVMEAAAMAGTQFEHFYKSGDILSVDWFHFDPEHHESVWKTLSSLKCVIFCIPPIHEPLTDPVADALMQGGLGKLLTHFTNLEDLTLEFEERKPAALRMENLLGSKFPNLNRILLAGVDMDASECIRWLRLHKLTLKHLHLRNIELYEGDWLSIFKVVRKDLSLVEIRMDNLEARNHWWYTGSLAFTGKQPQEFDDFVAYLCHRTDINRWENWQQKDWENALGIENGESWF
jgi:F-box-like